MNTYLLIASAIHTLSVVVWVGGMFFAYVVLRPALMNTDPQLRLSIWAEVFKRFLLWIMLAAILTLSSGFYMLDSFGSISAAPKYMHIMMTLGITMAIIYLYVAVIFYRRLSTTVRTLDWKTAGGALKIIRKLVAINLFLGLLTIIIATTLKAW